VRIMGVIIRLGVLQVPRVVIRNVIQSQQRVEEVGTYGEVYQVYGSDDWWNEACDGTNGTSYGSGALGGTGGKVEKMDMR